MTITIGNKRSWKPNGIPSRYVGRPSPLGNPFPLDGSMTRTEAIHQYTMWLGMHLHLGGPVKDAFDALVELARQGDLTLVCWCAPKPCHADVLKTLIERELEVKP